MYFVALLILFVIIGDVKIFHEKLKKIWKTRGNFGDPCCLFKKTSFRQGTKVKNIVNIRIMHILQKNTHTCNKNFDGLTTDFDPTLNGF